MPGLIPTGNHTERRAPPAIVTENPRAVPTAATNVGLIPMSCVAGISWLYARMAFPRYVRLRKMCVRAIIATDAMAT